MPLGTYYDLQKEIFRWVKQADVVNLDDDFISLVEPKLNDYLRDLARLATVTLTGSSGTRALSANPFDTYSQVISLRRVSGNDEIPLKQISCVEMDNIYRGSTGIPKYYCVSDDIEFDKKWSEDTSIKARVKLKYGLSNASSTNDLLTRYPNIYLFGALAEAFSYLQMDDQASKFDMKFQEAMKLANRNAAQAKKYARLSDIGPIGSYNILTDSY